MERMLPKRARIEVDNRTGGILATAQAKEHKQPFRKSVCVGPAVSWYGKFLIVGALLVTAGWELSRLIITILALD
jgi:hypothetical protein